MKKFLTIFLILIISVNTTILLIADETGLFPETKPETKDSLLINQNNKVVYDEDYAKGVNDARRMAKSSKKFFFAGFCLGTIGVILPHIMTFDPPEKVLLNKSPAYIMGFNDQYNKSMRSKNGKLASIGLISYMGIGLLVYVVYIGILLSTINNY